MSEKVRKTEAEWRQSLTPEQYKLYRLIWQRTMGTLHKICRDSCATFMEKTESVRHSSVTFE